MNATEMAIQERTISQIHTNLLSQWWHGEGKSWLFRALWRDPLLHPPESLSGLSGLRKPKQLSLGEVRALAFSTLFES